MEIKNVTFIGLGVMGYNMAGHLKKSGYEVKVYNRTESRAKKWAKEFFGSYTNEPANEASFFDIVFACVGNDDELAELDRIPTRFDKLPDENQHKTRKQQI